MTRLNTPEVPQSINVKVRFYTQDPRSGAEAVDDIIEFTVKSSNEDYSDFCLWTGLGIDDPASADLRTYKVADAE